MMKKAFGAVVLGSVFALVGCGGEDHSLEPGSAPVEAEHLATTEQAATTGAVNAACAESLTLRNSPGGSTIGTMYTGLNRGVSKFYIQSSSGGWSYGYSYSLGRWGYSMTSYLTTKYGESGTPGQVGYNFWCQRPDGSIWGGGIG